MITGAKSIASTDHPKVKISSPIPHLFSYISSADLLALAGSIREGLRPLIDRQYRHELRSPNTGAGRGNLGRRRSETSYRRRAASSPQFPATGSGCTSQYFCVVIFFEFEIHCSLLLFQMSFGDTSRSSYLLTVLVRLSTSWDSE